MLPSHMKVNSMADQRTSTEHMPREGQVTEVCREWLVHEDQALAYRLQSEEYNHHLGHNKQRNAILRQDAPKAREEQLREDEEAARVQHNLEMDLAAQEAKDAAAAAHIARELDRQEMEKQKMQEIKDRELAKSLLDQEKHRLRQAKEIRQVEREAAYLGINSGLDNVAILSRKDKRKGRNQHDESINSISTDGDRSDLSDLSDFCMKPTTQMDEDEVRRLQEGQDEELARLLQEQDLKRRGDLLQQDQLVAIENQDRELAKILQEQERAKAKKAKEKARQKALMKKQAKSQAQPMPDTPESPNRIDTESPTYETPSFIRRDRSVSPTYASPEVLKTPQRLQNEGIRDTSFDYEAHTPARNLRTESYEIHTLEEPSTSKGLSQYKNIACAIDPTYQRRIQTGELPSPPSSMVRSPPHEKKSSKKSPKKEQPLTSSPISPAPAALIYEEDDTYLPPPYMPIQGQRRMASLEKEKKPQKKKPKDTGCKQQ